MAVISIQKAIVLMLCLTIVYLLYNRQDSANVKTYNPALKNPYQQNYRQEIYTKGGCGIPKLLDYEQFYAYFEKPTVACKNKARVGGHTRPDGYMDGDKYVCFDTGFKLNDCVVYSFGINNEWSFDDAMDNRKQCQVFSFDPTMKAKDHKRSERISFFNLGIYNAKGYMKMKGQKCAMDSYRGIVEKLGHANKVIDYLKIDVEGSEIAVFKDILDNDLSLLDNVRQIGMEIHPGNAVSIVNRKFRDFWEMFHRLECQGFRLLSAEMNAVPVNVFSHRGKTRSSCYEVVWIKP